ncbi:hypothetical protein [Criblamydia sequanensis]|uniref:Uncharacterized protein n=1 Tax=Candidatus Criblamydia sequanensis CRIB-18 TaxID=1437425 RepID=A0A090CZT6_9BACT|nr:hypothetical protein [Criblamydia sequanensis]CDR34677.1 hypothetical protein CSEC_1870 [Criblamydia sequanensis CRIB-18]
MEALGNDSPPKTSEISTPYGSWGQLFGRVFEWKKEPEPEPPPLVDIRNTPSIPNETATLLSEREIKILSSHYALLLSSFPWFKHKKNEKDFIEFLKNPLQTLDDHFQAKLFLSILPETLAIEPDNMMPSFLKATFSRWLSDLPDPNNFTQFFYSARPEIYLNHFLESESALSLKEKKLLKVELEIFMNRSNEYLVTLSTLKGFYQPGAWQNKDFREALRRLEAKFSLFLNIFSLMLKFSESVLPEQTYHYISKEFERFIPI